MAFNLHLMINEKAEHKRSVFLIAHNILKECKSKVLWGCVCPAQAAVGMAVHASDEVISKYSNKGDKP